MWLLTFASKKFGLFETVDGAHSYLDNKYGEGNVTRLGDFQQMVTLKGGKGKTVPMSGRGRSVAFECKSSSTEGWNSTTRYEIEEIQVLG